MFYDQELAVQEPFMKLSWDTLGRRSTVEEGIGSLTVCKMVLIHLFQCFCVCVNNIASSEYSKCLNCVLNDI